MRTIKFSRVPLGFVFRLMLRMLFFLNVAIPLLIILCPIKKITRKNRNLKQDVAESTHRPLPVFKGGKK